MKLHLSKRVVTWAFVLLVAVSSVNMAVGARNYALLYAALSQLQFTFSMMTVQNSTAGGFDLLAQVNADNPVDYGALRATLVYITAYFNSSSSFLFRDRPIAYSLIISQMLPAHALTSWNFYIPLGAQNATNIYMLYNAHSGNVAANTVLIVTVSSFLDTLTGRPTYYSQSQNLTLTR